MRLEARLVLQRLYDLAVLTLLVFVRRGSEARLLEASAPGTEEQS